jgi:4-hydroxy-3-methylbut-2-enyl diphosphate reductase
VEAEAARRGLQVFDATCPLVTKVHMEVRALRARRAR